MMLKSVVYGYMNNVYSCRKIEERLLRDVHFIWLAGYEHPDYVTINRFRNRVKKEINAVFTQVVLLLAERGFVSLEVEYVDGTKMESKANKYTFVWRKTVERNRAKLLEKIKVLLSQIDDVIAQENASEREKVEFTPELLHSMALELNAALAGNRSLQPRRGRRCVGLKRGRSGNWRKKPGSLRSMTDTWRRLAIATRTARPIPTPPSCA